MSEGNRLFLDTVFNWFKTNESAAWKTILIGVIAWQAFTIRDLNKDMLSLKDDTLKEVRRAYDPKFRDLKETVDSSAGKLDSTLNNVNDYVNSDNK